MKILKEIRRKIKAWLYTQKLKQKNRQEEKAKKKANYEFLVATQIDDKQNENKIIIPFDSISLIYIEYVYEDDYNKYLPRKIIKLKDGRSISVKNTENAIFSTKGDIEMLLKKMV